MQGARMDVGYVVGMLSICWGSRECWGRPRLKKSAKEGDSGSAAPRKIGRFRPGRLTSGEVSSPGPFALPHTHAQLLSLSLGVPRSVGLTRCIGCARASRALFKFDCLVPRSCCPRYIIVPATLEEDTLWPPPCSASPQRGSACLD
jgi:hypothetical protein